MPHLRPASIVVSTLRPTEREISLSLRLDSLTARLEAAEAMLAELRAAYDALVAEQAEAVDDGTPASPNGAWLGHHLVAEAITMLDLRSSPGGG